MPEFTTVHLVTADETLAAVVDRKSTGSCRVIRHIPTEGRDIWTEVTAAAPEILLLDSRIETASLRRKLAQALPKATILVVGRQLNGVPTIDPEHTPDAAWRELLRCAGESSRNRSPRGAAGPGFDEPPALVRPGRLQDVADILTLSPDDDSLDRGVLRLITSELIATRSALLRLGPGGTIRPVHRIRWPEETHSLVFPAGSRLARVLARMETIVGPGLLAHLPLDTAEPLAAFFSSTNAELLARLGNERWLVLGPRAWSRYTESDFIRLEEYRHLLGAVFDSQNAFQRLSSRHESLRQACAAFQLAVYRVCSADHVECLSGSPLPQALLTRAQDFVIRSLETGASLSGQIDHPEGTVTVVAQPETNGVTLLLLLRRTSPQSTSLPHLEQLANFLCDRLRNPVAAIQMIISRLEHHHECPDFRKLVRETVGGELRQIGGLLDDLEILWCPETSEPCLVDLAGAFAEARERLTLAPGVQIHWNAAEPLDEAKVTGHRASLVAMFSHLLRNSIEAGANQVTAELVPGPNATLSLTLADDGPGFRELPAAQAQEPFVSTKHGHPGLGLALARTIVERHHGRFEIATDSRGARIRVSMPASASLDLPRPKKAHRSLAHVG